MFAALVIVLINEPVQATSEPRVSTMTCSDLSGNINTYTSSGDAFFHHPSSGYVRINLGTHHLYYPAHSCIYKEAKQ
jgi:hypothetical protein